MEELQYQRGETWAGYEKYLYQMRGKERITQISDRI